MSHWTLNFAGKSHGVDAAVTIGRTTGHLQFPDDHQLSHEHCVVGPALDGVTVRDLGSTNGTFVDGKQVAKGEVVHVRAASELRVGSQVFHLSPPVPGAMAPGGARQGQPIGGGSATAGASRPRLLGTSAESETFAGVTYHLDGELVPVLTIDVQPGHSVYFEHHIMLWKSPSVEIGLRPMKGAFKRMMAGMQIFVTEAKGHGQIAFSRDGAGHIFALHVQPGQEVHVREHQFLAATQNVDYTFERVKGWANMLFGGTGFFIDKFHGATGPGILWLHGYGNVFEKVLAPGEQIDVEPGGWLYKDPSVRMDTNLQTLSTGFFGSMNIVTNRFTGPVRVGLQSMYLHFPTEA